MPLATCPRCKKMFTKAQLPICTTCQPDEEKDYERIREIIDANPNLDMEKTAELAEVDIKVIQRMMEQGMVATTSDFKEITCGRCGAPAISITKRLCQTCLDKMNAEMAKAQSEMRTKMMHKPNTGQSGMQARDLLGGERNRR